MPNHEGRFAMESSIANSVGVHMFDKLALLNSCDATSIFLNLEIISKLETVRLAFIPLLSKM